MLKIGVEFSWHWNCESVLNVRRCRAVVMLGLAKRLFATIWERGEKWQANRCWISASFFLCWRYAITYDVIFHIYRRRILISMPMLPSEKIGVGLFELALESLNQRWNCRNRRWIRSCMTFSADFWLCIPNLQAVTILSNTHCKITH